MTIDENPPPLEQLPEDWGRALVIMAHPAGERFGGRPAVTFELFPM